MGARTPGELATIAAVVHDAYFDVDEVVHDAGAGTLVVPFARDFDTDRRRARRAGTLAQLDAGAQRLDDYVTEMWVHAHAPLLAAKTRRDYAAYYDRYVSAALGAVPLREITPDAIARLQAELLRAGLGHEATRKTVHVVLKGMLTHAVRSGLILANPARAVRMARAPLRDEVRPLAPETVEAIRAVLLRRGEHRLNGGSAGLARTVLSLRDATIVSVLAGADPSVCSSTWRRISRPGGRLRHPA